MDGIMLLRRIGRRLRSDIEEARFRKVEAAGGQAYTDDDLVYAATTRCPCGAGLAYPKGCGGRHHWDCGEVLTGRAVPQGQLGAVAHTAKLPFAFWSVLSEHQPSAGGATTRPGGLSF